MYITCGDIVYIMYITCGVFEQPWNENGLCFLFFPPLKEREKEGLLVCVCVCVSVCECVCLYVSIRVCFVDA